MARILVKEYAGDLDGAREVAAARGGTVARPAGRRTGWVASWPSSGSSRPRPGTGARRSSRCASSRRSSRAPRWSTWSNCCGRSTTPTPHLQVGATAGRRDGHLRAATPRGGRPAGSDGRRGPLPGVVDSRAWRRGRRAARASPSRRSTGIRVSVRGGPVPAGAGAGLPARRLQRHGRRSAERGGSRLRGAGHPAMGGASPGRSRPGRAAPHHDHAHGRRNAESPSSSGPDTRTRRPPRNSSCPSRPWKPT